MTSPETMPLPGVLKLVYDGNFHVTGEICVPEPVAISVVGYSASVFFDEMPRAKAVKEIKKVWQGNEPVTVSYIIGDDLSVMTYVDEGSYEAAAARTLQFCYYRISQNDWLDEQN